MIVAFCGHSQVGNKTEISAWLVATCEQLIAEGADTISQYTPTKTVMEHNDRPYQDVLWVMKEIIKSAPPIHDASGKDVIKWVVEGAVQIAGKVAEGKRELALNDKAKKILHFLFKS